MRRLLLCFAVSCAPQDEPSVRNTPLQLAKSGPAGPLPGTGSLRIQPQVAEVGTRFGAASPWLLEFDIHGSIPGRGLPPDLSQPAPLVEWYFRSDDESVVQIELPVSANGSTDEEHALAAGGQFDPPRLCKLAAASCLWGEDDDGRWRAFRIRPTASGDLEDELQLAHAWLDTDGPAFDPVWRVVTVWMEVGDSLEPGDRLRLTYVGDVPNRSTTWLDGGGDSLRPRLRYRPASPDPFADCPARDDACWVVVGDHDAQGLTLMPSAPNFLQVLAPFDIRLGETAPVRLVSLDAFANPSPLTASVQLLNNGQPIGQPIEFQESWSESVDLSLTIPGPHHLRPETSALIHELPQWTYVASPTEGRWKRLVGDLHIHTGQQANAAFARTSIGGDHRGQFTRARDALRYLREVAGHDFGALSEHSVNWPGWSPSPGLTPFEPGGVCAPDEPPPTGQGDWWVPSQQASWSFQEEFPDFSTFPAYEWHGNWFTFGQAANLHKVVLFRDHAPGTWDLQAFPGQSWVRPPQCLFHWLDANGYSSEDVLVIPHMMYNTPLNVDWKLTYAPDPPWDAMAGFDEASDYQRIGEIFSARNYGDEYLNATGILTAFEGGWTESPWFYPYTFRYAWRDLGAVIGVIGSSDNHNQSPGADDPWVPGGGPDITHEPGGAAFVLTDPDLPEREAIFEALHARRTYATSGIRAWLAFNIGRDDVYEPMGSEISGVTACTLNASFDLAVPEYIRSVAIWSTEVGGTESWAKLAQSPRVNKSRVTGVTTLHNPVPFGAPPQTWIYYFRAIAGKKEWRRLSSPDIEDHNSDAVWSSPIWVTWEGALCP